MPKRKLEPELKFYQFGVSSGLRDEIPVARACYRFPERKATELSILVGNSGNWEVVMVDSITLQLFNKEGPFVVKFFGFIKLKNIAMDVRSPAFPVQQKKFNVEIEGNSTDFIICSYDDHFFVLVTQIGSMGTILQARKEEAFLADPTFEVSIVFGKYDEPMITLCGRQLIEHISKSGTSKPLILSLGLKNHSMVTVKGIISAVTKNALW